MCCRPFIVCVPGSQHGHGLVGVGATSEKVGHQSHGPIDVGKERLVTGTQVIESGLPVRRL